MLQHGEQVVSRDDLMTNMESVTQSLVAHTLRTLGSIPAGKLATVSIAECSLVCMLSSGSFVQVSLSWELHYHSMKQGKLVHAASSKYASSQENLLTPVVQELFP